MAGFADATFLPIPMKLGDGRSYELLQLTAMDYLTWCNEATEERRRLELTMIPPSVKGVERFQMLRSIHTFQATPDDLVPYIWTPEGVVRLLKMAAMKVAAPADESDVDKWIASLSYRVQTEIAVRVSGLYSEKRVKEMFDEIPENPPNPPARPRTEPSRDQEKDDDQTGLSTEPSSNDLQAVT